MKKSIFIFAVLFISIGLVTLIEGNSMKSNNGKDKSPDSIYDLSAKDMSGKEVKFSKFEGKVLLIVNVASKCGYTPQYEGLQSLYEKYKDEGFEILAFPCNDFGGQEPGSNEEIKEFCTLNYGVSFPLFDKIKVLGKEKHPLYQRLTTNPTTEQGDIKWNFEKFLISKNGEIIKRFRSGVEPLSEEAVTAIESELSK